VRAVSEKDDSPKDSVQVARDLAAALEAGGCEYALGGAIALGFWAEPRGTLDVAVSQLVGSGNGFSSNTTVPEANCAVMLLIAAAGCGAARRRW
jgi:hypothetical protein